MILLVLTEILLEITCYLLLLLVNKCLKQSTTKLLSKKKRSTRFLESLISCYPLSIARNKRIRLDSFKKK
jgi:hypothetical protein